MTSCFFRYFMVLLFGLILTTQLGAQELDFTPIEKMITPTADFVGCMNINAIQDPKFHASLPVCTTIAQLFAKRKEATPQEVLPLFYVVGNIKTKSVYFLMKTQMNEAEAFAFLTETTASVSRSKWKKESRMAVFFNPYSGEKIYFFQVEKGIYFLGNQTSVVAIQKQLKLNIKSSLIPTVPALAKKSHFFIVYAPEQDGAKFKLKHISVFDHELDGKKYIYGIAQTQPFKNPSMMRVFYISLINGYLFQETKSQEKTAQLMKYIAINVKAEKTTLRLELNSFSILELSKILFKNKKALGIK